MESQKVCGGRKAHDPRSFTFLWNILTPQKNYETTVFLSIKLQNQLNQSNIKSGKREDEQLDKKME